MSEHDQQCALVTWFDLQYTEIKHLLFAIPNGSHLAGQGWQRQKKGHKLKKEGVKCGIPDLFLAKPEGFYCGLFIEMKDVGKKANSLSDSQKFYIDELKKSGYCARWAAGFEEAKKIIEVYLSCGN